MILFIGMNAKFVEIGHPRQLNSKITRTIRLAEVDIKLNGASEQVLRIEIVWSPTGTISEKHFCIPWDGEPDLFYHLDIAVRLNMNSFCFTIFLDIKLFICDGVADQCHCKIE